MNKITFIKSIKLFFFIVVFSCFNYFFSTQYVTKNSLYINNDLLAFDINTEELITLNLNEKKWIDLRSELDTIYVDRVSNFTIEINESIQNVVSTEYYISDQILGETELDLLETTDWTTYDTQISISEVGKYIVYIKLVDDSDDVLYINSDYIVFNGYTQDSLFVGRNALSYDGINITNKSAVTLQTSFTSSSTEFENHTHNLMSNILLPKDTIISLIDQEKDKVYQYQIPTDVDNYNYNLSCDVEDLDCIKVATYPFTLFKEVGTFQDKPFVEDDYVLEGVITENFTIVIDFINTNFETNYSDVSLYVELRDSTSKVVRPTLFDSLKKFNIYSTISGNNAQATLNLTTDYSLNAIILNTDSTTNINITSALSYKKDGELNIYDTRYENKKMGIAIHLEDSEGNLIDREYFKNVTFKIGDQIVTPNNDNIIRFNLDNTTSQTKILTIIGDKSTKLSEGNYVLKINNYTSLDGYYYQDLNNVTVSIPLIVEYPIESEYGFNVSIDKIERIVNKDGQAKPVQFEVLLSSDLTNPNLRVTLYKKNSFTAFNQDYTVVDLANHTSDQLIYSSPNTYLAIPNLIKYDSPEYLKNYYYLNLSTDTLENNGYMFVFDLYDGDIKISSISKKIIVKQVFNEQQN